MQLDYCDVSLFLFSLYITSICKPPILFILVSIGFITKTCTFNQECVDFISTVKKCCCNHWWTSELLNILLTHNTANTVLIKIKTFLFWVCFFSIFLPHAILGNIYLLLSPLWSKYYSPYPIINVNRHMVFCFLTFSIVKSLILYIIYSILLYYTY